MVGGGRAKDERFEGLKCRFIGRTMWDEIGCSRSVTVSSWSRTEAFGIAACRLAELCRELVG